MRIPYDFYQVDEINSEKEKFRARAVSNGKISVEKLAHWMHQKCSIGAAEAKSFMIMLFDCMMDFLKMAIDDLSRYVADGRIKKYGVGHKVVYLMNV